MTLGQSEIIFGAVTPFLSQVLCSVFVLSSLLRVQSALSGVRSPQLCSVFSVLDVLPAFCIISVLGGVLCVDRV